MIPPKNRLPEFSNVAGLTAVQHLRSDHTEHGTGLKNSQAVSEHENFYFFIPRNLRTGVRIPYPQMAQIYTD
jgi:hypothetical protein